MLARMAHTRNLMKVSQILSKNFAILKRDISPLQNININASSYVYTESSPHKFAKKHARSVNINKFVTR